MILKTKFDPGEVVWHATNFAHKVVETEIVAITIHVRKHDVHVIYLGRDGHRASENGFYRTEALAIDGR